MDVAPFPATAESRPSAEPWLGDRLQLAYRRAGDPPEEKPRQLLA
jgi:hypothetical protein